MIRYLSRKEVAEHLGVAPATLNNYRLPEHDALTGHVRGWLVETVDRWHADRPGRGSWRNRPRPTPR